MKQEAQRHFDETNTLSHGLGFIRMASDDISYGLRSRWLFENNLEIASEHLRQTRQLASTTEPSSHRIAQELEHANMALRWAERQWLRYLNQSSAGALVVNDIARYTLAISGSIVGGIGTSSLLLGLTGTVGTLGYGALEQSERLRPNPELEDFIEETRQELRDWLDHKKPANFRRHFLKSEALINPFFVFENLNEKWEKEIAISKKLLANNMNAGSFYKVEFSLWHFFETYLQNYRRDNARMSDFIEYLAGNCEAQTKLILSSHQDQQISPPSNRHHQAVQIFSDHLQAVYFAETKNSLEVWNLLDNAKSQGPLQATLYDPHILLYAFLKKLGRAQGFTTENFLLKKSPEQKRVSHHLKSNSILSLPEAGGVHSTNPPPFVARLKNNIQNPEQDLNSKQKAQDPQKAYWGNRLHPPGQLLDTLDDTSRIKTMIRFDRMDQLKMDLGFTRGTQKVEGWAMWASLFFFKKPEDRAAYEALNHDDRGATLEFFEAKAEKQLRQVMADPFRQRVLSLIGDPQQATLWSVQDLKQAKDYLDKINITLISLHEVYVGNDEDQRRTKLINEVPGLKEFQEQRDQNREGTRLHPEDYLGFLQSLPYEKQGPWIQWLQSSTAYGLIQNRLPTGVASLGFLIAQFNEIGAWTVVPKVALENEPPVPPASFNLKGVSPQATPTILGFVDVDLENSPGEFTLPKELMLEPPPKATTAETKRPKTISLQNYLELVGTADLSMLTRNPLNFSWTEAMSREFLALNYDNRYTHTFVKNFKVILDNTKKHRPSSEFKYQNPLILERTEKDERGRPQPSNSDEIQLPKDLYEIALEIKNQLHIDPKKQFRVEGIMDPFISGF